jgi:hypothetical protein
MHGIHKTFRPSLQVFLKFGLQARSCLTIQRLEESLWQSVSSRDAHAELTSPSSLNQHIGSMAQPDLVESRAIGVTHMNHLSSNYQTSNEQQAMGMVGPNGYLRISSEGSRRGAKRRASDFF